MSRLLSETMFRGYQPIVCAYFQRRQIDYGVPGYKGVEFKKRDFGYACVFWPLKQRNLVLSDLILSERFSEELGHKKIDNFDEIAKEIFKTVRFVGDKE